jgi:hypothetical protein
MVRREEVRIRLGGSSSDIREAGRSWDVACNGYSEGKAPVFHQQESPDGRDRTLFGHSDGIKQWPENALNFFDNPNDYISFLDFF